MFFFYLFTGEQEISFFLVLVTGCTSVGKINDSEIFRINATQLVPLQDGQDEEIIAEVCKLLNSGTFYFSVCPGDQQPIDLTLCSRNRGKCTGHTSNPLQTKAEEYS